MPVFLWRKAKSGEDVSTAIHAGSLAFLLPGLAFTRLQVLRRGGFSFNSGFADRQGEEACVQQQVAAVAKGITEHPGERLAAWLFAIFMLPTLVFAAGCGKRR